MPEDKESGKSGPRLSAEKILGWLSALGKAVFAFFILILADYMAVYLLFYSGYNPKIYEGMLTSVSAVFIIILMTLFFKVLEFFEHEPQIKMRRPEGGEVFSCAVIALGLLGITMMFIWVINMIGQAGVEAARDAAEEYSESMQDYSQAEDFPIPAFDYVLSFIGSSFLIPLAEELVFRAGVMGQLLRKFPAAVSIILSAVIFGLAHGVSLHITYALVSGLILGCIYYFTSSIWCSALIHSIFNFLGGALFSFLESDVVGMSSGTISSVYMNLYRIDLLCMAPAAIAILYLYHRKKLRDEEAAKGAYDE